MSETEEKIIVLLIEKIASLEAEKLELLEKQRILIKGVAGAEVIINALRAELRND